MEPNNQMPPQMPPQMPVQPGFNQAVGAPKHPHLGMLLTILAIVVVIAAGLYAWQMYMPITQNDEMMPAPAESMSVDSIESQGNSTEPSAIESDVDAQSAEDFDREIDSAFVEFDAAFQE